MQRSIKTIRYILIACCLLEATLLRCWCRLCSSIGPWGVVDSMYYGSSCDLRSMENKIRHGTFYNFAFLFVVVVVVVVLLCRRAPPRLACVAMRCSVRLTLSHYPDITHDLFVHPTPPQQGQVKRFRFFPFFFFLAGDLLFLNSLLYCLCFVFHSYSPRLSNLIDSMGLFVCCSRTPWS